MKHRASQNALIDLQKQGRKATPGLTGHQGLPDSFGLCESVLPMTGHVCTVDNKRRKRHGNLKRHC